MSELNVLIIKVRKFENMIYEEIVVKIYEFFGKYGLVIYNKIIVCVLNLYSNIFIYVCEFYGNVIFYVVRLYNNFIIYGF